jgi:uncharacterized protein YprB with RNaseH-like and TPR domain
MAIRHLRPEEEKIGFLDIETSNLVADFGIILTWAIKDGRGKTIYEDVITLKDIQTYPPGQEDTRIVKSLIVAMHHFDRLVTYYGTRFDVPYIRTRAMTDGVKFPDYGAILHTDLYYVVRGRFKLSSNRLENANRVLLGKTQKTRVDSKYWRGGVRGDQDSLKYILDHNRKDVLDLEKLFHAVKRFAKHTRRSL